MMFSYLNFYDRLREAKRSGIDAVEFWKWSDKDIDKIADTGVPVSIFNIDSKNEKLSYELSRGILNDGRANDLIVALEESVPIYKKLSATGMIVLIGENATYNPDNVYHCLNSVRGLVESEGVTLLIEPLNNIDRAGYSMPYSAPVFEFLNKLNSPNIKMLYDIYHQNMMNDFSLEKIKENIDRIGHFHVADAPGRHEPGTGNVDYVTILREIDKLPYSEYIGLEYRATVTDSETFGFLEVVKNV